MLCQYVHMRFWSTILVTFFARTLQIYVDYIISQNHNCNYYYLVHRMSPYIRRDKYRKMIQQRCYNWLHSGMGCLVNIRSHLDKNNIAYKLVVPTTKRQYRRVSFIKLDNMFNSVHRYFSYNDVYQKLVSNNDAHSFQVKKRKFNLKELCEN